MFSKYSKINIPQNYSGSRFRVETETKMHKPTQISGIKNAHSPSFVTSARQKAQDYENENFESDDFEEIIDNTEEYVEDDTYYEDNIVEENDHESDETDTKEKAEECIVPRGRSKGFDFSSIKNIFSDINSEELLILGLILLIASDKDGFSDGTLWILALLLLSKNDN